MFFPLHTDAPLYHRPYGTLLLIFVNIGVFLKTSMGLRPEGWILRFGQGLHPAEWLTSAFLHFGPMHLIGNLFFLWAFGLLIEGKLGFVRFLALYLALAAVTGCIIQLLTLNMSAGGAGGASTVLFALMVICLLWAPQNTFDSISGYRAMGMARVYMVEVSVISMASYYLIINLLIAWLDGFRIGTEVLHLTGAVVGVPVGLLFLKRNWVDCEGWDLLTLWKKDLLKPGVDSFWGWKGKTMEDAALRDAPVVRLSSDRQLEKIREKIDNGQPEVVIESYLALRRGQHSAPLLTASQLHKLIQAAKDHELWKEAAWLLQFEYLPLAPANQVGASLLLAMILTQHLQRPRAAIRVLHDMNGEMLTPRQRAQMTSIRDFANAQIQDGVIELTVEPGR